MIRHCTLYIFFFLLHIYKCTSPPSTSDNNSNTLLFDDPSWILLFVRTQIIRFRPLPTGGNYKRRRGMNRRPAVCRLERCSRRWNVESSTPSQHRGWTRDTEYPRYIKTGFKTVYADNNPVFDIINSFPAWAQLLYNINNRVTTERRKKNPNNTKSLFP